MNVKRHSRTLFVLLASALACAALLNAAAPKRAAAPAFGAPAGLKTLAISAAEVDLAWSDNARGVTGFVVERMTGTDGAWTPIATLDANTMRYRDTTVTQRQVYTYRVAALLAAGRAYSNVHPATTPNAPNPDIAKIAAQGWNRAAVLPAKPAWTASIEAVLAAADRPGGTLRTVPATDDQSLRAALKRLQAGTHLRIAPGQYKPDIEIANLRGTPAAPIVIEGADPDNRPMFRGGTEGWKFSNCEYLVLRNLDTAKQPGNGVNVDDGGKSATPAHHIALVNIHVTDVGPQGEAQGLKLSGVDDFLVRGCVVQGWGGEAIDMVGCHRGLIDGGTYLGKVGFSQGVGIQAKGGSRQIVIRENYFSSGGFRAIQLGGSTGRPFYRPQGVNYEAQDMTVEGNTFVGSEAAVAFTGVDGAVVRYNTIYQPRAWVMRILQETTTPGFVPSRNGRFEHNLVLYLRAALQEAVNVGRGTSPETFTFAGNTWYCMDNPAKSKLGLPTAETGGVYGVDPRVTRAP